MLHWVLIYYYLNSSTELTIKLFIYNQPKTHDCRKILGHLINPYMLFNKEWCECNTVHKLHTEWYEFCSFHQVQAFPGRLLGFQVSMLNHALTDFYTQPALALEAKCLIIYHTISEIRLHIKYVPLELGTVVLQFNTCWI